MDWRRGIELIGIADASLGPWETITPRVIEALRGGLPAVMLRDRTGALDAELVSEWGAIATAVRQAGGMLIVNRRLELAKALGADAIQLGKEGPTLEVGRERHSECEVFGYSAHSLDEAGEAFANGFQYVTLSPVFASTSKPGAAGLGVDGLRLACEQCAGPVVALGGIDGATAGVAREAGAAGVAAIRGVFRAGGARGMLR